MGANLRKGLPQALLLLFLTTLFGISFNLAREHPLVLFQALESQPGELSLENAANSLKISVFLDARREKSYQKGHIQGALRLDLKNFHRRYPSLSSQLEGKQLVVYCGGPRCPKANGVRKLLESEGHQDVQVFRGGFSLWQKHHLPIGALSK